MRKRLLIWAAALLVLLAGAAGAEETITSVAQLNRPGMIVGVGQGSAAELAVRSELPEARIEYFNDRIMGFTSVAQGKIDAYVHDRSQMELTVAEGFGGVRLLDENMSETVKIALGISPVSQIPDLEAQLNSFIRDIRADGTLDEMLRRWQANKTDDLPEIKLPENPSLRLTVGTSGVVPPYSYYAGSRLTGFDIELAYRFAARLGADVRFKVYDYGAIIPAAVTGDVDCIMANLHITPERREALPFSDIVYEEPMAVMVKDGKQGGIARISDLNGMRIGVQTGTAYDRITADALPDAKLSYFNSYPDMAAAMKANKIDGFPGDGPVLMLMAAEDDAITVLNDHMDEFSYGYVFPKNADGDRLLAQMNAWLETQRENGELQRIVDKWISGPEKDKLLPDCASFPAPNGTLRLATEGAYAPLNYYRGGEVVGLEIDMTARFCEDNGFGLTVEAMSFDGILPAIQAGKADFAAAGISITEERAQTVNFSDPYYTGGTMMAVLKSAAAAEATLPAGSGGSNGSAAMDALNGKTVGVQTGTSFDELVGNRLPDSRLEYFNSKADLVNALTTQKIDAFTVDEPVAKSLMREHGELTYLPEYLDQFSFGFVFPMTEEGAKLRGQFSEFVRAITADGTLADIEARWFGDDETQKKIADYSAFPAPNGTLRLATEALYEPFEYYLNNGIAGYDIDIAVRFCEAYGYGLEIVDMSYDAVLPAVQTGKCDFGGAGISITPERAESVLFSEPNYTGGVVMVVRRSEDAAASADAAGPSFWDGIVSSFNKTFIREDRWQLFLQGIANTLLITVLAILFGTALGFLLFMLCRNGNLAANTATRFSMWLVQGMPMVVLLMILYYIIFGSTAISGIAVAVIGFTLTFGAAVFGMLKMGVNAVDRGQYEAAYALGHSNRHTFFRIILPQAIPHILPAYQSEIVGLIKATAIVGYIAVQDLTKMGDIVRSRTFEAFFPLIAIAVIYFALEGLFSFAVSRIRLRIDPKKRRRDRILKGVNTHD